MYSAGSSSSSCSDNEKKRKADDRIVVIPRILSRQSSSDSLATIESTSNLDLDLEPRPIENMVNKPYNFVNWLQQTLQSEQKIGDDDSVEFLGVDEAQKPPQQQVYLQHLQAQQLQAQQALAIDTKNSEKKITKNALRQRQKRQKKEYGSYFIPNQNNVINTDTEHDDEAIQQALLDDAKEQDGDKKPRAK